MRTADERVDLPEVCRRVVDELEILHPGRTVALDVTGDPHGEWDPHRVAQVVSNLCSNALQHAAPDSSVAVRVRGSGETVLLEVWNQGATIPPNALEDIFEPFRRAPSSAQRRPGGLGLGLYIVREIARAHRAEVQVRSTDAEGTTFSVEWPR